jgi:excisionase family DNA binding protein
LTLFKNKHRISYSQWERVPAGFKHRRMEGRAMGDGMEWMSVEQTSQWLGVPVDAVREAVRSGAIPALVIGGYVRVSRAALLGRAAVPVTMRQAPAIPVVATQARPEGGGLPVPAGFSWVEDLAEADEFIINWPRTGGGSNPETYPSAWRGVITLNGVRMEAKVGECVRHDRGRLTVLFDRNPICEFVATTDGQGWASVIKPDGKKVLTSNEALPLLYLNARIASYREATGLSGIGVPKGLAVVVARDDLRGTVHQAAARWLGRNRFPVIPAA